MRDHAYQKFVGSTRQWQSADILLGTVLRVSVDRTGSRCGQLCLDLCLLLLRDRAVGNTGRIRLRGQAHGRKDLRRDLLTDRSRDLLGHILLHGGSNSRADGRFLCIDGSRYLGKSRLISLLINGSLIERSQRAVEHLGIVADRQLRDAEGPLR